MVRGSFPADKRGKGECGKLPWRAKAIMETPCIWHLLERPLGRQDGGGHPKECMLLNEESGMAR